MRRHVSTQRSSSSSKPKSSGSKSSPSSSIPGGKIQAAQRFRSQATALNRQIGIYLPSQSLPAVITTSLINLSRPKLQLKLLHAQLQSFSTAAATTQQNSTPSSNTTTQSTTTTTTSHQAAEYDEKAAHRVKPKQTRDVDHVLKMFGNPNDEDPSEPIVRSILPNGIIRATGIENPRLGAFVTIHLGGNVHGLNTNINTKNNNNNNDNSMQPTIQPVGNQIQAEIIRITKHEVFLALPISPHLVNIEDRVSKTKDRVPGFKVPIMSYKDTILDESLGIESPTDPNKGIQPDVVIPMFGSVINAFGDTIEQIVKPIQLGDELQELKANHHLNKTRTIHMPYSNLVAKNVLKSKLKLLPYILGTKKYKNETEKHQYQQLYQSFDDSVTYSNDIDMTDSDDDDNDSDDFARQSLQNRLDNNTTMKNDSEIINDTNLSIPMKRASLTQILNKNKHFIEAIDLPTIYRANNTAQILTGIPTIDLLNPIRKGSRMLFTSTNSNNLTQFGQTLFKNTLQQVLEQNKTNTPTTNTKIQQKNQQIRPDVDNNIFPSQADEKSFKLIPESFQQSNTIGIYCAIGKTTHQKDTLINFLGEDVLKHATIIYTNDNDTPYTHTQAVKQAIALSNALRVQGKDVVVVLDDLSHHATAVNKLNEPFTMALGGGIAGSHHVVNSTHASLLDSIGTLQLTPAQSYLQRQPTIKQQQIDGTIIDVPNPQYNPNQSLIDTERDYIGSSTAICLYTTYPESSLPSINMRQSEHILDGLKSIADRTIPFHDHLQSGGFWPPLEVQQLHPVLPTISPIMRTLLQHTNAKIIESQHVYEYAQISEGLGITLDFDAQEVLEWKPKLQALLMQSQTKQYTFVEQFVLLFSAAQDRILAGIEVVDVPTYKRFLLKQLHQYPTIMNILSNIVNVSTVLPLKGYKRRFINPSTLYNENDQIMDSNGQPLTPQDQILDDKTRQLLQKQTFQPYLSQTGQSLSPIEEFIGSYVHSQINIRGLTDITTPLFKRATIPGENNNDNQLPPDVAQIESLVQKLQQKFRQHKLDLQTKEQALIFESMCKSNTVGRFGLPIILDELLQIIVDDAHEDFLCGKWQLDPSLRLPQSTIAASTSKSAQLLQNSQYSGDVFQSNLLGGGQLISGQYQTEDGTRIESQTIFNIATQDDDGRQSLFDPGSQSVDMPTKGNMKPKDHPLNIGIGKSLGMESNPAAAIEQQGNSARGWFW